MSRCRLVSGVVLLLLLCTRPAAAQDEPVVELDSRGRMLMEIIDTLERDLERLARTRRELNKQKERLETELARLQERITRVDTRLRKSKRQIEKLLRSMALMKEPDDLLLFFAARRYHDLHVYKRAIREVAVKLTDRLSALVETRKQLERRRGTLGQEARTLNSRRETLLAEIEEVERIANRTRTELTDRTRKIAAIENLFMTATLGAAAPAGEGGHEASPTAPDLGNLDQYRRDQDLRIPVSPGQLIKGFEEMPEPPYGTEKMVRGWVIVPFVKGKKKEATHTAFVRAPSEGVVVYVGEVPGFGLTLVLDHGHRYHTVYANLFRTQVVKGDRVEREQTIGTIKSREGSDNELPYLYFELRRDRIAVDPKPYFLLRPLKDSERRR